MQFEQPGWREGPIYLYAPLPSYGAAFMALNGILAALHARTITGRGQWVETSLHQGVLAMTTQLWQDVEYPGDSFWGIPMNPQMNVFECADGLWVHTMHNSGGRGKDRSALFRILDLEPFEFQTMADPAVMAANEAKVRAAIRKIPRKRLLGRVLGERFRRRPGAAGARGVRDEQVINNGMVVEVDDPVESGRPSRPGSTLPAARRAAGRGAGAATAGRGSTRRRCWPTLTTADAGHRPGQPARPLRHALEGIKVLDLGQLPRRAVRADAAR